MRDEFTSSLISHRSEEGSSSGGTDGVDFVGGEGRTVNDCRVGQNETSVGNSVDFSRTRE